LSIESLEEFLEHGKEWKRVRTSIPGVFVLKLPRYKGRPARLAVELNPVDRAGSPTKRRGLVLRSLEELDAFHQIYQYRRLQNLLGMVEEANPEPGELEEEEVIEL